MNSSEMPNSTEKNSKNGKVSQGVFACSLVFLVLAAFGLQVCLQAMREREEVNGSASPTGLNVSYRAQYRFLIGARYVVAGPVEFHVMPADPSHRNKNITIDPAETARSTGVPGVDFFKGAARSIKLIPGKDVDLLGEAFHAAVKEGANFSIVAVHENQDTTDARLTLEIEFDATDLHAGEVEQATQSPTTFLIEMVPLNQGRNDTELNPEFYRAVGLTYV